MSCEQIRSELDLLKEELPHNHADRREALGLILALHDACMASHTARILNPQRHAHYMAEARQFIANRDAAQGTQSES